LFVFGVEFGIGIGMCSGFDIVFVFGNVVGFGVGNFGIAFVVGIGFEFGLYVGLGNVIEGGI